MLNKLFFAYEKKLLRLLVCSLVLPGILLLGFLSIYFFQEMHRNFLKAATEHLLWQSISLQKTLDLEFGTAFNALENIAILPPALLDERSLLQEQYKALNSHLPWVEALCILDEQGRILASAGMPALHPEDVSRQPQPGNPDKKPRITEMRTGANGSPHFFLSLETRSSTRSRTIRLQGNGFLFSDKMDRIRLGRAGEAFVVNADGVLQTRSVLHGGILDRVDAPLAKTDATQGIHKRQWNNATLWYAVAPMDRVPGWRVVVQREEREILYDLHTRQWRMGAAMLVGVLVIAAIAWRTGNIIHTHHRHAEEEWKHMTQYHIQVQKLDAISQLGVGIAHEVNNPLAIIGEEAGWMQDVLKRESFQNNADVDELRESLRQIVAQTVRSREITHKLLSFGGKTDGTIRDVRINSLVSDIVALRRREADQKHIEIHTELAERLPIIHTEPALLRQLLLNLINNAMDSMPDGGRISIITTKSDDGGVSLRVQDTGFGIPEENMPKIFDPFFTTKPPGKGAGLGLSISHGLLQRIGGQIVVSSQPGQGSSFVVKLPRAPKSDVFPECA